VQAAPAPAADAAAAPVASTAPAEAGAAAAPPPAGLVEASPVPAVRRAQAALPTPTLGAPLTIADPASLAVNLRDLIRLSADDHTTMKLLQFATGADPRAFGPGKRVYAAVLNVAIRPGWRTFEGYVGEIDVRFAYSDPKGNDIADPNLVTHPIAYAVMPGIDAQIWDERLTRQFQYALALVLEAQTPEAGGRIDADYVRRLEQRLASVTTINTVMGYNASGRQFGWRFSPRIVAQGDPTDVETRAAHHLQTQSFPALVLILLDEKDLGTFEIRHLTVHYASRWLRAPDVSSRWWRPVRNSL
jgi:hypothetical protein